MTSRVFATIAAGFLFACLLALAAFGQPSRPLIAGGLTPTIPAFLPIVLKPLPPTATPTATATNTPPPATATPTSTAVPPTATATNTATTSPANARIAFILYDPPGTDLDGEYVRIDNTGGTAATLTDWTLADAQAHVFTFPAFTLGPGASVRVWTKAGVDGQTDLYWGSGQAIWNNTGDTATLRDGGGQVVSVCSYAGGGESYICP